MKFQLHADIPPGFCSGHGSWRFLKLNLYFRKSQSWIALSVSLSPLSPLLVKYARKSQSSKLSDWNLHQGRHIWSKSQKLHRRQWANCHASGQNTAGFLCCWNFTSHPTVWAPDLLGLKGVIMGPLPAGPKGRCHQHHRWTSTGIQELSPMVTEHE